MSDRWKELRQERDRRRVLVPVTVDDLTDDGDVGVEIVLPGESDICIPIEVVLNYQRAQAELSTCHHVLLVALKDAGWTRD